MQYPLFPQIVLSIFFSFGFWHKPNCFKFAKKQEPSTLYLFFYLFKKFSEECARQSSDAGTYLNGGNILIICTEIFLNKIHFNPTDLF